MSENAPPPKAKDPGFSIVELMVAIMIVAILAVVISAASKEVGRKSNDVKCMSNLRSLVQAARLYANDHNGYFTHRNFMHGAQFLSKKGEPEPGFREYAGLLERSSGVDTVFTCPTMQRKYRITKYAENRNYVINRYATFEYAKSVNKKFTAVPEPVAMAYLMDGTMPVKEDDDYQFQTHIIPAEAHQLVSPHNGFTHVAFVDGHLEALKTEQITAFPASASFWTGGAQ